MNSALQAKAMVDGLGKNYANLQAVVKICQLFISELSTVIDSTNQILIPGAGIMERRHHGMSTGSPAHSLLTRPLSVHPVRPRLHSAISNGSLFAGYFCSVQRTFAVGSKSFFVAYMGVIFSLNEKLISVILNGLL